MRFSSLATAIASGALRSGAAFALDAAQPTPGKEPAADVPPPRRPNRPQILEHSEPQNCDSDKTAGSFYHECMKAQVEQHT